MEGRACGAGNGSGLPWAVSVFLMGGRWQLLFPIMGNVLRAISFGVEATSSTVNPAATAVITS
jgi:hypothetical protein